MTSWRVLQLADAAFPMGGFVHSGGLEAMVHAGPVDLRAFCRDAIGQCAHGAVPFVAAAWDAPERHVEIDAFAGATIWSHVAARASTAQGWALLDVAARAFGGDAMEAMKDRLARGEVAGHLAPIFGCVSRHLDVARDDALQVFLHQTLRGVLSAAVRLGVAGPAEAQRLQASLAIDLDAALALGRALGLDDVAQVAPLLEIHQTRHDLLYSRLFRS